ncbi:efflux transporter outer membrane subunit [Oceanibaculum pacificum]|uniref:Transporter n=1 Tax=Oceanibaculum pacificum TaxID=580166 RepID=A0A154W9W4_9PROT|nr:efflux transporter outer membrane subunit [Oceanibaculum pacificum]KZD10310.1 hypothetical protein AUP43_06200 [Oceanibaculum pacificum]
MKKLSLAVVAALALSACATEVPTAVKPITAPSGWRAGGDAPLADSLPGSVSEGWWTAFDDPEMDVVVAEALEGNFDLRAAGARVQQAQAVLRSQASNLMPQVNASGGGSYRTYLDDRASGRSFDAGIGINYTVDLWGGLAAAERAAAADLAATEQDRAATALDLSLAVAQLHLQHRALLDRLAIATDSLETAERLVGLVRSRYDAGAVSRLDLSLTETNFYNERASVESLRQSLAELENSLSLLLGKPPAEIYFAHYRGSIGVLDVATPPTVLSMPASVLARRPDIQSAELRLASAEADIEAARAALLPSLTIGVDGRMVAETIAGAFDPTRLALAIPVALAQAVFDGGRRQANIDIAVAQREQLLQNYGQAVLGALVDVEDALVAIRALERREASERLALDSAEQSFRLSEVQYGAGRTDSLTLLTAQQTLLRARTSVIDTRSLRLQAIAALYAALGYTPPEVAV